MFDQLLHVLSWLAIPVVTVSVVDDWFRRPLRRAAAPVANGLPADAPLMALIYLLVPVTVIALVLRLLRSETLDFALVLLYVIAGSGLVVLADRWLLAPRRAAALAAAGKALDALPLPTTVDYARSFLPVAVVVLIIRAFIFEPFRIPSDSMMPTLQDGDFIAVNKFAYGFRLPVLNSRLLGDGVPERGEVVVFRWPPNTKINYIKRVVGLPGDRVAVKNDLLYINGVAQPIEERGNYSDGCYHNLRLISEDIGGRKHAALMCRSYAPLHSGPPAEACDRDMGFTYVCDESASDDTIGDAHDFPEREVPAGHYLMIGDNRDNSSDGREWGFVPDRNLVGRATRIWFNWDWGRRGGPQWSRIGRRIE